MDDFMPQITEQNIEMEVEEQEPNEDTIISNDEPNEEPNEEEELVEVEPRPRVDTDEIFKKNVKKSGLDIIPTKKPKRKMSDKQLENLKKAREKAAETRKKNRELRQQGQKVLTKKQKIKEDLEKKEIEIKKPIVHNHITNNITKEDIIEISKKSARDALVDYEIVRKQRKEQKKKDREVEDHKKQVRKKIEQATTPSYKNDNPYAFCY